MISGRLDFKRLKRTVSIAAVLADKGILSRFKRRSDKLTGPCPVHGGDNPGAFVANLSKNIWHCFTGCSTGGDVIDLVRFMDGKSHRQAGEYLARLACSPVINVSVSPSAPRSFRPFTARLSLDPNAPLLRSKGIIASTARRLEAGAYHGKGFLDGCIGVRLHDPNGQPVGYAGRRLDPIQVKKYGKWKFPAGLRKSQLLYNFHRIRNSCGKGLVVVECPWGVLRLSQLTIPAVSLLGTSMSATQFELIRALPCIILMMDGDFAGKNAMNRISKTLYTYTKVRTFKLPPGHDPDDLHDNELSKVSNLFLS